MSNSLNFLNKPTPTKTYGPQPKPSTAAPKAAFLDKSNPWAVGGGTPTASAKTPARQPAPKTQTPAKTQQRAAIPSRGYNYTDASYTGATPQQRTQEIEQAAEQAQAARRRRDTATTPKGAPAQPAYNPIAAVAPRPAQPWQMAPTAEQAMAVRPQPAPGQPAAPIVPTNAWLLDGIQPGQPAAPAARQNAPAQPSYNPLPQGTGTNVPTAPGAPNAPAAGNAAQPQARGPFYGYAPPGPLTAPRTVDTQRGQRMPYYMTDRPNVSGWGQRALMTDEALAVEDARRQRDAAGSFGALQASGRYRPWSSYSPAEKYYLRYGVMPEGAQLAPDTSGAEALAANEAQNQRLYDEYWDRYGNVIRGRRWYGGTRPGQEQTMYGSEMAAAMQGRTQGTAPAATRYDPLSSANTGQPAATQAAPTAPGAQARINNYSLAQVNPAAVRNGVITNAVTEDDVSVVARQILQRYRPELAVDGMNFVDIVAVLAKYVPPQDRAAKYNEDAQWLGGFLSR